ncbi:DUF5412 family protein [Aquibacillus rhizosphaerae]|uniref:DUF5412 family protein n=1 Tax=Aquibacillus rhizosphaerae TaxID=3051431 RepID=A0ABT7L307_9BACI|nr:DUF5412 family protein [Aquibacillus sp. LR5S19]MDL4840234.1 DUF5412 family protein [Aquibacillus sp. LR5S19]
MKRYSLMSFYMCLLCLILSLTLILSSWTIIPSYVLWLIALIALIAGIKGFKDRINKISKIRSWFTVITSLLLLISLSLVLLFGTLRTLVISEEFIKESKSPDGTYTVEFYLTNGGATTAFRVIGKLDGPLWSEKLLYGDYRMDHAKVEWVNNHTISINNHVLNLKKDETYSD